MTDTRTRCPGCKGLMIDNDWWAHTECMAEREMARKHDERDNDDYTERDER